MNIVITGASKGIGFEAAKLLARTHPCNVFAISRNKEGLARLQLETSSTDMLGKLRIFSFDLSSGRIRDILIPEILSFLAQIDVLINNAGMLINKPFEDLSPEDFDRLFEANVKSAFLLAQALVPFMPAGAHIVNIGSMGGFQGSAKFKGLSLYSASKGALAILSECMAEELRDKKISVNCLALGSAQTDMLAQAFPGYKAPLSASEMARFIVDFALTGHQWFNGRILPVSLSTP